MAGEGHNGVGPIFTRYYLQKKPGHKVGARRTTKDWPQIQVKYANNPLKWVDSFTSFGADTLTLRL